MSETNDAPPPSAGSDLWRFFTPKNLQGPLLLLGLLLAMAMVNSPLQWLYDQLLNATFEIRLEQFSLHKHLLHWINDGLMALFFLLVAIEIKHEAQDGVLSRPAQIVLPGVAALGGIAVPALLYWLCTRGDPVAVRGWAIPTATDIAFSLAVLSLFGARVPRSLTAFLMVLAVFDDLGAILIIAVFHTAEMSWAAQGAAAAVTLLLFVANRLRITKLGVYWILGAILWVCVLRSGVHATLAGVVLGFALPARGRSPGSPSPMQEVEHKLHPWVALLVLPLFAFANSGVPVAGLSAEVLRDPVTLGIALGLVIGKPLGICGTAMLLIRTGLAPLPEGSNRMSLLGTSMLAGIGFTMSMFLGMLSFTDDRHATAMRLGVLGGSLVSGIFGALLLRRSLARAPAP